MAALEAAIFIGISQKARMSTANYEPFANLVTEIRGTSKNAE
jgi:hypothetical protein